MATSLDQITPPAHPPLHTETLMDAIVSHFETNAQRLAHGDPTLPDQWNQLDLLKDEWIRVTRGPTIISGRARGISPEGGLLLEHENRLITLFGGQVLRAVVE